MARGVNKVTLLGNLGKDPELTYTPSGLAIAKFSLATTENRKNSQGEWEPQTEWHRIVIFGKMAETAGQYLTKGGQVFLEGKISYGSYEREGIKHYTTDIIVNNMVLVGGRGDSARQSGEQNYNQPPRPQPQRGQSQPQEDMGGQDYEEDLPF